MPRGVQVALSFWMNKQGQFADNDYEYVLSQNNIAARTTNIQFIVQQKQFLKLTIVGDSSQRTALRLDAGVVLFDVWQHICVVSGVRGVHVYVGGLVVPPTKLAVLNGNMQDNVGSFTMTTDLFLGGRTDRHPNRFYLGYLSDFLIYTAALSANQVGCLYQNRWDAFVQDSCYLEVVEIDAEQAGAIGVDGSQSFCGPSLPDQRLWHAFEGLVSGVKYVIGVAAVNDVGHSVAATMHFAARTALMQVVPLLIERSVTKPQPLVVESMLVNLGDGRLHWNISQTSFIGNMTVLPQGGTVEADGVGVVSMTIQSPGLSPGLHRVEVSLSSNAATRPGVETIVVMMSVDSNAVAHYSRAEGSSLSSVTRGRQGYKVFILAFDGDNEVAVAGSDPFQLRIDNMPARAALPLLTDSATAGQTSSTTVNITLANASDTPALQQTGMSAIDWSDWYPTEQAAVRNSTLIGFGAGVYRAEYDAPDVPGYYLTSVMLNGVHIQGSPFVTQSVCGLGEYDNQRGSMAAATAEGSSAAGGCDPCDTSMVVCARDGLLLQDLSHMRGVWRSSTASPHFHWCDNGQCLPAVGPLCAQGYAGVLCRSCDAGYGKMASGCLGCPAPWIGASLCVLVALLPLATLRWWERDHLVSRARYRSQLGAIDKIAINFLTCAGLLPAYQSAFPPVLEGMLAAQRAAVSFGSGSRLLWSCVADFGPGPSFIAGTMTSMGMPLLFAGLYGLALLWHLHSQRFDRLNAALLRALLILYLSFPYVLLAALEALACVTVDPDAPARLSAEPALGCPSSSDGSSEEDRAWVGVVGGLAGVGVTAIPLLCLLPVWRARRSNTLEEETLRWRYGWLYAEYEYTMWEAVVLLRKAFLALIPALLVDATPQSRYLSATCLFFFAILVHALLLPYSAAYAVTAQCELVSLLCSFAVFACCFFREGLAQDDPTAVRRADGVSVAIVLITAFALVFFQGMHRLVAMLESDGDRSGPISWADIQVYFCYSLVPSRSSKLLGSLRHGRKGASRPVTVEQRPRKAAARKGSFDGVNQADGASDVSSETSSQAVRKGSRRTRKKTAT
jgi:hypothetical protein